MDIVGPPDFYPTTAESIPILDLATKGMWWFGNVTINYVENR